VLSEANGTSVVFGEKEVCFGSVFRTEVFAFTSCIDLVGCVPTQEKANGDRIKGGKGGGWEKLTPSLCSVCVEDFLL